MRRNDLSSGASDTVLVAGVRAGSRRALAELYARHSADALRVARIVSRGRDAEELVAEAFVRVVDKIVEGGGPSASFRAYLHTVIRNLNSEQLRRSAREQAASDKPWLLDTVDDGDPALLDELDADRAARALDRLPESWRSLLWELEVLGRKPAEVAADRSVAASTVSSTAYRAREGLRLAYLDEHLPATTDRHCEWTRRRLSRLVRGGLSPRTASKTRRHLDACPECAELHARLAQVNTRLGAALWPLVLTGGTASAGLGAAPGGDGGAPSDGGASSSTLATPLSAIIAGTAVAVVAGAVALGVALSGGPTDSAAAPPPATPDVVKPERLPAPSQDPPVDANEPAPPVPDTAPSPRVEAEPPRSAPQQTPVPTAPPPPPGPADLQVGAPTVEATGQTDRWLLTVPVLAAGSTPTAGFPIELTLTMDAAAGFVERLSPGWDCGAIEAGYLNEHGQWDPYFFDTVTCSHSYEPGRAIPAFQLDMESVVPAGSIALIGDGNADPDPANDARTF